MTHLLSTAKEITISAVDIVCLSVRLSVCPSQSQQSSIESKKLKYII